MRIEIMDPKSALELEQFLTPWVKDSKDRGRFVYYVALEEDVLMGMLVLDPKVQDPEILSIAVSADHCNEGVATNLLRTAVHEHVRNYREDDDTPNQFIACFPADQDNAEILKKLFTSAGFRLPEEGAFYTCNVSDIAAAKLLHENSAIRTVSGEKLSIKPLKEIDKMRLNSFGNRLADAGVFPMVKRDFFDEDVSFFKLDKDGSICSCMMFLEAEGDILNNALAYMESTGVARQDLLLVFTASAMAIEKKFPMDARVNFLAINDTSVKLIEKLIPNAQKMETSLFFELPFADIPIQTVEEKYGDPEMHLLTEETMVCSKCRHSQHCTTECAVYLQKPDRVMDGGECGSFEEA